MTDPGTAPTPGPTVLVADDHPLWLSALKRDLSRPELRPLEPPEKGRGLEPDATERWLREFGLDESQ